MTRLLKELISRVERLPEDEQEALAAFMLEELADEERWAESFARSSGVLSKLAADTRAEIRAGRTTPLDELLDE